MVNVRRWFFPGDEIPGGNYFKPSRYVGIKRSLQQGAHVAGGCRRGGLSATRLSRFLHDTDNAGAWTDLTNSDRFNKMAGLNAVDPRDKVFQIPVTGS